MAARACMNCQHPRASHLGADGRYINCMSHTCTCGGFEEQGWML